MWYATASGVGAMPIRAFLGDGAFSPEDVTAITSAFEGTLRALGLSDRTDPAVSIVARRTIELAKSGARDPILLRDAVLNSFRNDAGASGM
jgi:hypothetical protein